jgi:Raf kinase inhibitor-like protein, YbhB/YbcL family|nr:YbhB/YbcL family Raf kinase inhibitor-like protein [uncultured Steroidobacter sp.]
MKLTSSSFQHDQPIPEKFAFGAPDPVLHIRLTDNYNPHLQWRDAPAQTRSFALICVDPDVPTRPDDVNQEGRSVPASLPRTDFYHWVMVDIPPQTTEIKAGECSSGIVAGGKQELGGPAGSRQGVNDYTGWFAGDADMKGTYRGYDGPCPPWNDEIVHHYNFTVYALDCARAPVEGDFTGQQVLQAIRPHILAQATLTGTYSNNPKFNQPKPLEK